MESTRSAAQFDVGVWSGEVEGGATPRGTFVPPLIDHGTEKNDTRDRTLSSALVGLSSLNKKKPLCRSHTNSPV